MKKTQWLLAFLILVAVMLLGGCACRHESTVRVNVSDAACGVAGYTGDRQCEACETIVSPGEQIPALNHIAGEAMNSLAATCTQEGCTGDVYCTLCGVLLEQGTTVGMLPHTQSARSGAYDPNCTSDGYTGDTECTVCHEKLSTGEAVPALGHTPGERENAYAASCNRSGNTGHISCTVCGEMIEAESTLPMIPHTPGDTINAYESTCSKEGYTGNVMCSVCGGVVSYGEAIPMLAHTLGEAENASEATCLMDGYTGDRTCTVCGQMQNGEIIEKLPHTYEGNTCTECEWMVAGIYLNGEMAMPWQQLLDADYIKVKETTAVIQNRGLTGLLVVEEGITLIERETSDFYMLEGLYLPASYTHLGNGTLFGFNQLKFFRSFGLVEIQNSTNSVYSNVFPKSVQQVILNEGLEKLGDGAFIGASGLTDFELPSTVKVIGAGAFRGCSGITEILLPEGVEFIGNGAFSDSGVKMLVIPSGVTYLGNFAGSTSLESIDLSATAIANLPYEAFSWCTALKEIKLPATITKIDQSAFKECSALERLVLPEKAAFNVVPSGELLSLKEIVWPVSVTELAYKLPALEKIYYRGSEMQWNFVAGRERYSGAEIVFNYTEE